MTGVFKSRVIWIMEEMKIKMTDSELKSQSKEKIKEKVKTACKEAAFAFLKREQVKVTSKLGKINYTELKMQDYLKTSRINNKLKKFTFRARMRMISVSKNYGGSSLCPLCKHDGVSGQVLDSQEHLLDCVILKQHVIEIRENVDIKHDDIYEENSDVVRRAAELLYLATKKRAQLLRDIT